MKPARRIAKYDNCPPRPVLMAESHWKETPIPELIDVGTTFEPLSSSLGHACNGTWLRMLREFPNDHLDD